ncbi:DUF371 domain-containing protein [Candidatus Woesearchaeota archaeon]|nr:DUF371 domain-containing protein [Candidatus Woesearchaeota archaeon]
MEFFIFGHSNISAAHKTTLEFTKDKEVSKRGTCIVGVDADFYFSEIKKLLKAKKIEIDIEGDKVIADVNPDFNDKREIVVRRSDFKSERTLGINANKAAVDLKRSLIKKLQNENAKVKVKIKAVQ